MNCEDTLSRSLSNELNADPAFLTPEHAAGEMRSVSRNCQAERCRDADRGRDVERRAVRGDVADDAVDCAATELDRSAFQNAVPWCSNPSIDRHRDLRFYHNRAGAPSGIDPGTASAPPRGARFLLGYKAGSNRRSGTADSVGGGTPAERPTIKKPQALARCGFRV
jgi:hypothetical protein